MIPSLTEIGSSEYPLQTLMCLKCLKKLVLGGVCAPFFHQIELQSELTIHTNYSYLCKHMNFGGEGATSM